MRLVVPLTIVVAATMLAQACRDPSSPKPDADATPVADDSSGSDCLHACAKLGKWGCPEGTEKCVEVCEQAAETSYLRIDAKCILEKTDKSQLKACNVRCGEK